MKEELKKKNLGGGFKEKESLKRNQSKTNHLRGTMEKRNQEAGVLEESWKRDRGGASGRHFGGSSGDLLGSLWGLFSADWDPLGDRLGASFGPLEGLLESLGSL